MTTSELLDLLRHAYDGDPWHGPSLKAVLSRVSAESAAARPVRGRHTIWEIVLHLTGWTREVERRVASAAPPQMPEAGDWPAMPAKPTRPAWKRTLDALEVAHRSLEQTVASAPKSRWAAVVGTPRDPALGSGYSYGTMVIGLATHLAYHAGQIALLTPRDAKRRARPI
jgi:DinB superfamily